MPFLGESMCCVMCGKVERSDPRVESQWRAITVENQTFYACPEEFPPDTAGMVDFRLAYLKILMRCLEIVSGKQ